MQSEHVRKALLAAEAATKEKQVIGLSPISLFYLYLFHDHYLSHDHCFISISPTMTYLSLTTCLSVSVSDVPHRTQKRALSTPRLTNLNEDPQCCSVVVHFIGEGLQHWFYLSICVFFTI